MVEKASQIIKDELEALIQASEGKVHRDVAFEHILSGTELSEERIRKEFRRLRAKGFIDERGMMRGDPDRFDFKTFEGDIAGLKMTPGGATADDYHGLTKLKDNNHPLIPSQDSYYRRDLTSDGTTDVEVLCQAMADADFSPLLLGEAGTGKDTLVLHVCSKTNRPVVRVNFGSDIRYEDLVGMYVMTDVESDGDDTNESRVGTMRWRDGQLTAAVRHGWTFIADEINAAPPESTMHLHQVTEERDKSSLVLRERGEIVEPHPQFRFVATMNPPSQGYGGTNRLNDAFKSRFYTIEIDYLDPEDEAELLKSRFGEDAPVGDDDITTLCELADKMRTRYKQSEIVTPITTRELLKVCKLSDIMSTKDAAKTVLCGHVRETDRDLIEEVIETYF